MDIAIAQISRTMPPRRVAVIVFALAMGGFAIGTSEFVVMGLISEIARGFGVTEPQLGHVVSAYALGVVVGAPLLALGTGAIGFAGMFAVFSYLPPTLVQVTGMESGFVPIALAAFGLGGILGSLAGGWLFDRYGFRAAGLVLLWSLLLLLVFPLAALSPWTVLPAVVAVGTMGALAPVLQSHLMDVAGDAQTLAAASNHSAFNAANALGPWLGGMAINAGLGWTSTALVGAATALAGLLIYACASMNLQRQARATQC